MTKRTLLAFYLCLGVTRVVLAQQTPVPVGNEPRHLVKFENQYVRVIEANIPVGDTTLFHTHSIDNIPVAISGGKLKTEVIGQEKENYSTVKTGSVGFAKASYSHRITNVGTTPLRFIDVEILSSMGDSVPPAQEKETGYERVLDNKQVRIYRLILEPGQKTGLHRYQLPGLRVAVSGGKVAVEPSGEKARIEECRPADFQWLTGRTAYSIKNVGSLRYEAVYIEWK